MLPNKLARARKKFWKNSKGVSGILATIFMVLTVLFLYAHVYVFIQNENRRFEESIREANQMDIDYSSEKITISDVIYTAVGDQVHVQAKVTNNGPISVQMMTLWVVDTNTQKFGYNDTLDIDLDIGDTLNFAESNALIVTVEGASSSHKFTSWFITVRGNLISLEREPEDAPPSVQAFGVFSLDWFVFNYASETYPAPRTAGAISKTEDYISFFVKVTNNYNETMTIKSSSMLMLLIEWQEPLFYIVKEANYPKWTDIGWSFDTSAAHTGSRSAHADSGSNTLTSMDLDASDAMNITVSFWYRDDSIDDDDNAYLQFWDGSTYDNIFELGNTSPENTWHYYTVTTSDPQYLISDFCIRFDATGLDSGFLWEEDLWIDDVLITKNTGGGEVTLLSDDFESTTPISLTAYDDADPITVAPRSSATLAFAAATAGVTSWAWGSSLPIGIQNGNTPEGAVAMVALVFTMESNPTKIQAQSLPFRALVLN